ncbi:hypothetical protein KSC_075250 [Ktedonobacter sp. SOSP1-52]|uniref:GspE/PulE/PilB domain-containing protein n=1 Tax=Ktedonobacter sp. SOSP1-52 TaxID=2778366 RepID=UPI001915BE1E|nr:hypothetical protein [Ktedonobacter sp. SOSP1-52]GHO68633.1 hypothetical protein KSC_075250 [Ktedonobacter sp. SOSP1-52]
MITRLTTGEAASEKQHLKRASIKSARGRRAVRYQGDPCTCQLLPLMHIEALQETREAEEPLLENILLPTELLQEVQQHIQELLAQRQSFSLFALHIVQVERRNTYDATTHKYVFRPPCCSHPAPGFMNQLEDKIKAVLRGSDQLRTHGEGSALLFLPGVGSGGAYNILERIYAQVDLLEAETIIPPLRHETHIVIGYASFPEQQETYEGFLQQLGRCARRVTLKPRMLLPISAAHSRHSNLYHQPPAYEAAMPSSVPFMHLPTCLPRRLTRLIPHRVACTLRCVPVGREQQALTVALADPSNRESLDYLAQLTHMTIFPVACKHEELDILLATKW